LGGEPVDGAGILGEIRLWWQKLQDKSDNIVDILHDAYVGENRYGIHMSHEMVSGDIDETSAKLIDEILEEDQMRVDQIKQRLRLVGVDV
jgi:bacterioferritin